MNSPKRFLRLLLATGAALAPISAASAQNCPCAFSKTPKVSARAISGRELDCAGGNWAGDGPYTYRLVATAFDRDGGFQHYFDLVLDGTNSSCRIESVEPSQIQYQRGSRTVRGDRLREATRLRPAEWDACVRDLAAWFEEARRVTKDEGVARYPSDQPDPLPVLEEISGNDYCSGAQSGHLRDTRSFAEILEKLESK